MQTVSLWQLVDFLRADALRCPDVAGSPAPIREARVLAHTFANLPVCIPPGTLFVGDFTSDWEESPDPPGLESRFAAWSRRAEEPAPATPRSRTTDVFRELDERFFCRPSAGGQAHTTVDYPRVIGRGLGGVVAEITRRKPQASGEEAQYLEGMVIALEAVMLWSRRHAALAHRWAEETRPGAERERLLEIAIRCGHVPAFPARSVLEALQAIWLVHVAVAVSEHSGSSLSLGRLDQYLYPLFLGDLARGVDEADLRGSLAGFFRKLNGLDDGNVQLGMDPSMAVNLGGVGLDGRDQLNPLSELITDVVKELRLPGPLLAVRVHRGLSPAALDRFLEPELVEMGQPTFYGEEPCRAALLRRGVARDVVHAWAANSCMGLMMPGEEWSNMWGSVVNVLLPLELALNGGRPFAGALRLPFSVHVPAAYATFEQLFEVAVSGVRELVDLLVGETAERTRKRASESPNPFVSSLLGDCVRRGRDRLVGGCRYQTVIVEAFGLVNAADALLAIRKLVFEEGRWELSDLVRSAMADFAGYDEVLRAVLAVPKYRNGDPEADALTRDLAGCFAAAVSRHSGDGIAYLPSFHTLSAHIPAGARMGASLDGRRAGEPLAKNVGTSPGRAKEGHTALMRSAATIGQTAFSGGQALDVWVDPRDLGVVEGRRKVAGLLRTYFELGGLQVQVNGVSPGVLRAAMEDPSGHRDVLVRKAGFTTRFVTLPRFEQDELVERFEAGM